MSIEVFLILFCVGIAAGILSGLFGVGGGVVIVPSLIAVYSFTGISSPYIVHIAIATSLFTIIFTSASSAYKHTVHKNVIWTAAVILGLASSITVFLFSKLALSLPGDVVKKIFSVLLFGIAIKMMIEKNSTADGDEKNYIRNGSKLIFAVIGMPVGIVAAFTGLGGGILSIPLMHYFVKLPIKKAIGTSTAAILITSVSGVISYFINSPYDANTMSYSFGMVDTVSAIPVVMASIPFAQLGVLLHKKTRTNLLKKLFAGLLLCVSLRMLFF